MWPRIVELLLAGWLAMSPWIVSSPPESERFLRFSSLLCAVFVAILAICSFRASWEKAHLGSTVVGLWLIAVAFVFPASPPPPAYQNYVVTGLLLMTFAILPSRASESPRAWQDFWDKAGR